MAMAVLSPYKANEGNVSLPRDASFSSYLEPNERDFVRNLTESIHSLTPAQDAFSPRISLGRKNPISRSDQLGVFGAERYFNDKLDHKRSPISKKDDRDQRISRQRHRRDKRGDDVFDWNSSKRSTGSTTTTSSSLKSPTPSIKSQGSWNNNHQIGFFLPKKTSVGLKILSGFQCRGFCFDKKSICTAATTHQLPRSTKYNYKESNMPRKSRVSHHQQEHFAFPIIDTVSPQHYHNRKSKTLQDDQPRKSLEVFGSSHQLGKQDIQKNLERKLSILTWDAIPNASPNAPFPFPNTTKTNPTRKDDADEVEDARISDASSDLFEIENLSRFGQGIASSQSFDTSSCKTLVTHNDTPSEASIEWSVVTASAAELSMVSDDNNNDEKIAKMGNKIVVDSSKVQRNSSASGTGLLGCRNHKAVDVIEDNYHAKNHAYRNKNSDKGSPDIAPSTPSRRSPSAKTTMKNYVLAYA